jgi:lysophospholipase L1-like esterase
MVMFRILFVPIVLLSVILQASGNDLKVENPLALQLPPAIYAVPGVEMNIYFDNVILAINPGNYVFDIDCPKGYNDAKRWRFLPTQKDIGEYPLKIRVLNNSNQVVGQAETKVVVSPGNAGAGKNISLLAIGDSLTNANKYPRRINALFKQSGNPRLRFVGSHCGGGRSPGEDGVCHEGYGGWSWATFCGMWSNRKDYRARSKFLVLEGGQKKLDFNAYFVKYNNGKAPDFIIIMLGTNDVFAQNDSDIDARIRSIFKYMDMFLSALLKAAPDAKIGITLTPPPAGSQDAFGANYKCGQTRWQFKRNQHRLVQSVIRKFKTNKNKNISLVPVYTNLDTENGFPVWNEAVVYGDKIRVKRQRNGVHPADRGYNQIGDSFFSWMKYQLNK